MDWESVRLTSTKLNLVIQKQRKMERMNVKLPIMTMMSKMSCEFMCAKRAQNMKRER